MCSKQDMHQYIPVDVTSMHTEYSTGMSHMMLMTIFPQYTITREGVSQCGCRVVSGPKAALHLLLPLPFASRSWDQLAGSPPCYNFVESHDL